MAENYDLIIIGAGSAGLTAAQFAARAGAKVALIEKHRIGGDCTWTGCVPSKALLKVAKVAHTMRSADLFGIESCAPVVDMSRVRDHLREVSDDIYHLERPELLRAIGIEIVFGAARFHDAHTIHVTGRSMSASHIIIATGAGPIVPEIKGLAGVPYLSYEQIFEIDKLPCRLAVIGAGATGCELSQAFQRLGADVTLIDFELMPALDKEVGRVMRDIFKGEGIRFIPDLATAAEHDGDQFRIYLGENDSKPVLAETLLVAAGRRPSFAGLGLPRAGIDANRKGIQVDESLRTSAKHIYAVGDCNGGFQSTHYAGWQGYQAARNALFPGHDKGVSDRVPNVIYTDPEVAHVGLSEVEALAIYGHRIQTVRMNIDHVDRAITDRAKEGFIKIVQRANGQILGATIVAARAGEMITEFTHALEHGWNVRQLATTSRAYPTYAIGVQRMAFGLAVDEFVESLTGRIATRLAGFESSKGPSMRDLMTGLDVSLAGEMERELLEAAKSAKR